MCHGTYVVSYSCGHVVYTTNVCLQDIAPHYRCEPRGMKITQPPGRCVECYARELEPTQNLQTTAKFTPELGAKENTLPELDVKLSHDGEGSSRSSVGSPAASDIAKWIMALPPGLSPSFEQRSFIRLNGGHWS
ncbi:hypothetical protein CERZMDRAFT_102942 [Cercospora zeae-maydis SCOH1-5]|uniref:Uncharacterized protein n=1 Tax=Cercospora zeae-maydis SCOH1-5 TaxID=717836 RepID=A0A6A6F0N0_9PEZI|nr:hypothetical protein CERZMDRAFT_102942 [Cercospora zeae-maydis SCOH1-5]